LRHLLSRFAVTLSLGLCACSSRVGPVTPPADAAGTAGRSISGTWDGSIGVDNDTFAFELSLQQAGSQLSGQFIYINFAGVRFPYSLLTSSRISGDRVYIDFDQPGYQTRLTGTINSSSNYMSGNHIINGNSSPLQIWSARRR